MHETTLSHIERELQEAGVQTVWAQWSCLGAGALQDREEEVTSIIDPEALLLLSLYLIPAERRLRDFVYWWAEVGSELLSVQRIKTLVDDFPPEAGERLERFSRWAMEKGDKRWRPYASEEAPDPLTRDRKGPSQPDLKAPPSLLLRLRAGFGVSAKADVLAYLLGIDERSASTQEATGATGYSRATVRNALGDLSRAGFIEETAGRPTRYFAPRRPWAGLLYPNEREVRREELPMWRYWGAIFPFLAKATEWARDEGGQTEYLMSTRARDLFEEHADAFEANRIRVPRPDEYRGAAYLEGFTDTIEELTRWIPEHL